MQQPPEINRQVIKIIESVKKLLEKRGQEIIFAGADGSIYKGIDLDAKDIFFYQEECQFDQAFN